MADTAGPHLLVVDDDEDLRARIRCVLETEGWRVTEAHNGARALALLRTMPLPDLVLLDLVMPGFDGLDVLSELRGAGRTRDLPIVALSARGAHLSNRLAEALGADECISKPLDAEVLRERCAAAIAPRVRSGGEGACEGVTRPPSSVVSPRS
jgi:CheY-like chemotaxis protein